MINQDFDLYVTYAQEDYERVRRIVEELEWIGLRVWFRGQPESSADSLAMLNEQIREGRAHLVVWSQDSAASGRVQAEARQSSAKQRLVAARIDPVLPPRGTKALAYGDLSDWQGGQDHRGLKKILHAIYQLTGKGVAPDPTEEATTSEKGYETDVDQLSQQEKDERAWRITLSYNTKTYYEHYLEHFPDGKYVVEARERLERKKRTLRIVIGCAIAYVIIQTIISVIINVASVS